MSSSTEHWNGTQLVVDVRPMAWPATWTWLGTLAGIGLLGSFVVLGGHLTVGMPIFEVLVALWGGLIGTHLAAVAGSVGWTLYAGIEGRTIQIGELEVVVHGTHHRTVDLMDARFTGDRLVLLLRDGRRWRSRPIQVEDAKGLIRRVKAVIARPEEQLADLDQERRAQHALAALRETAR